MHDQIHREESVFLDALEKAPGPERQQFLEQACGQDRHLRDAVDRLLWEHDKTGDLLGHVDGATVSIRSATQSPISVDDRIGPYQIRERLGEGGFGVVYVAEQSEPVKRKVALKVIKPGMDTKEVIARFEAERQALAMMDHPNVAQIFDAGETENGLPYFVMELVKGVSITDFCDSQRLPTRERLQLLIDVCRAVQHAHQKGIIHRDLKPSNVMVSMHDELPVVKVIDFGVAKALDQKLTEKTIYTSYHQMLGTPMYMSPEQAQMSGLDIDTRSDVYSLGVLAYEVITGTTPFEREAFRKADFDELRRIIREDNPVRPSDRLSTLQLGELSTVCDKRQVDQRQLRQILAGELDWIVMKALEKDRKRRYQSARDLAEDVHRYLDGEAVEACPPSFVYRSQKFAKQHSWLMATVACIVITALIGSAISLNYARRSHRSSVEANRLAQIANQSEREANVATANAMESARLASLANDRERKQRIRAERALYLTDTRLAVEKIHDGVYSEAFNTLCKYADPHNQKNRVSWEWYYLLGQASQSVATWSSPGIPYRGIDWSPDGRHIATTGNSGKCEVHDVATGKRVFRHVVTGSLGVCVAWSPDSRFLAWGTTIDDQAVHIFDLQAGTKESFRFDSGSVWDIAWNTDQDQLLVCGIVDLPKTETKTNVVLFEHRQKGWEPVWRKRVSNLIYYGDWNHDASRMVIVPSRETIALFSLAERSEPERMDQQDSPHLLRGYSEAAFANRSNRLALGKNGEMTVWKGARFDEQEAQIDAHFDSCRAAWSPDDRWLATGGPEGTLKIWDTETWNASVQFNEHRGSIKDLAWAPDSNSIATCGDDGYVHVHELVKPQQYYEFNTGPGRGLEWIDDDHIRSIEDNSRIVTWRLPEFDIVESRQLPPLQSPNNSWRLCHSEFAAEFSSDEKQWVRLLNHENVSLLDGQTVSRIWVNDRGDRSVLYEKIDSTPWQINLPLMESKRLGKSSLVACNDASWSPSDKYLALVGGGVSSLNAYPAHYAWLHLFDASSCTSLNTARFARYRVHGTALAWSPNGESIAAASADGNCGVFGVPNLERRVYKRNHQANVLSLAWHPDGSRIASGGRDRKVHIWDAETGETYLTFEMPKVTQFVAWSPSGNRLAAMESSGLIRVWDSNSGFELVSSCAFQKRMSNRSTRDLMDVLERRDFDAARSLCQRLFESRENFPWTIHYYAALLFASIGDEATYRQWCERMFEGFHDGPDETVRHFVCWAHTLAPMGLVDYHRVISLAEALVDANPDQRRHWTSLGAIRLRAGQLQNSLHAIEEAFEKPADETTSETYLRYFKAMCHWKLNQYDQASAELAIADQLADAELSAFPEWNREMTIRLLRNEARQLIKPELD